MKKITILFSLLVLALTSASAQEYPFVITTDASDPALYYIYSGRDGAGQAGGCVFCNEIPYGESKHKLVLMYKNPNNVELTQLWYFMEDENKMLKIISAADGRMVTVANTSDGAKKVYMQTEQELTNKYYTWTLHKSGNYYAFKTSDGKTFLSHNGNWQTGGPQMGLYNADGSKDEGSRVFFEACTTPSAIHSITTTIPHPGIYTLGGQRMEKATHPGIYIVNGKKAIVR